MKLENGSTATMVFGVAHIVWYCSQFFILRPGDVILTGDRAGVEWSLSRSPSF